MRLFFPRKDRVAAIVLCVLTAAPYLAHASQADPKAGTPSTQGGAASTSNKSWTMQQAITSSVVEAWNLVGKSEDRFVEMVEALTAISADKRGVTLPQSKEAGLKFGELIKTFAKQDPDQLLYVIVDKAVQQVGTAPSAK
jgi:hypothetical protein